MLCFVINAEKRQDRFPDIYIPNEKIKLFMTNWEDVRKFSICSIYIYNTITNMYFSQTLTFKGFISVLNYDIYNSKLAHILSVVCKGAHMEMSTTQKI